MELSRKGGADDCRCGHDRTQNREHWRAFHDGEKDAATGHNLKHGGQRKSCPMDVGWDVGVPFRRV